MLIKLRFQFPTKPLVEVKVFLSVMTEKKFLPGVNFINVLRAPFSYESLFGSYSLLRV